MLTRLLSLIALFALTASLPGAEVHRYEATPGSKVTVAGTSTLHDWTVESALIAGFMELEANFPLDAAAKPAAGLVVKPRVEVAIPARSLKSGKTLMDQVMHDALEAPKHPKIEYKCEQLVLKDAGPPLKFEATGTLTVHGVSRPNTMPVTIERLADGKLKVTGTTAVKMTDHGIKPPSPPLAGSLIKTGDEVKIAFEWVTVKK
jgi:polyisoprenoid-binding protein YceI